MDFFSLDFTVFILNRDFRQSAENDSSLHEAVPEDHCDPVSRSIFNSALPFLRISKTVRKNTDLTAVSGSLQISGPVIVIHGLRNIYSVCLLFERDHTPLKPESCAVKRDLFLVFYAVVVSFFAYKKRLKSPLLIRGDL